MIVTLPATAGAPAFHLGLAFSHDSQKLAPGLSLAAPLGECDPIADPDAGPVGNGLGDLSRSVPTFQITSEGEGPMEDSAPSFPPLRPFGSRLLYDVRDLVTAPARISGRDWAKVGVGALIVGAVSLADDRIRELSQRTGPNAEDTVIAAEQPLANGAGFVLVGASWLAGRALHRPGLQATAADSLEASLIAAGLVTPALKRVFGRARPREDLGPHAFDGGRSFPSGETTQAFALASVVTAHYRQRWVRGLTWSLAGVTAWGRIRADGHWASDVVAGAFIGAGVGRWIVHRNRPELRAEAKKRLHWSMAPAAGPDGQALAFRIAW